MVEIAIRFLISLILISRSVFAIDTAPLDFSNDLQPDPGAKAKIAIVVDDLGDSSIIAKQLINLPNKLTMAILPQTPFATLISQRAANNGHEVIMHLPMEALSRPDLLGPGALFEVMNETEFEQTLIDNAKTIPHLIGFNNHMGSLLTQSPQKMHLLMKLAKQNDWYFLDSKTTEASVAQAIAKLNKVSTIGRDIFLDHHGEKSDLPMVIKTQFEKAKRIARTRGHVVVICHPYQETYDFLQANLSAISDEFELVKLSELMTISRDNEQNVSPGKTEVKIAKTP